MAYNYAADLTAFQGENWLPVFSGEADKQPLLPFIAKRHDIAQSVGKKVIFPIMPRLTAYKPTSDSQATQWQTITPSVFEAEAFELVVPVAMGSFAQVTSIISIDDLVQEVARALAEGLEKEVIAEAVNGPADEVGTDATALTVATLDDAVAQVSGHEQNVLGWLLSSGGANQLRQDAAVLKANEFGRSVRIDGARALGTLYGFTAYSSTLTPEQTTGDASALLGVGTLHYTVLGEVALREDYDMDQRSDRLMAHCTVAVKYFEQHNTKGVRILHS